MRERSIKIGRTSTGMSASLCASTAHRQILRVPHDAETAVHRSPMRCSHMRPPRIGFTSIGSSAASYVLIAVLSILMVRRAFKLTEQSNVRIAIGHLFPLVRLLRQTSPLPHVPCFQTSDFAFAPTSFQILKRNHRGMSLCVCRIHGAFS